MATANDTNIIFLDFREHYRDTYCIFEIHPKIADFIRDNKIGSKKVLEYYLDADNHFVFLVKSKDTDYMMSFIKEIERVGNSKDPDYVINRLITDNGKFNHFINVKELLEKDFELKDPKMQLKVMCFFSEMMMLKFNLW